MNILSSCVLKKREAIDHDSVVGVIYKEGELSSGYFLQLTLANLIALIGLITKCHFKDNVTLNLEQVKVQPGGLKDEAPVVHETPSPTPQPVLPTPKPPSVIVQTAREDTIRIFSKLIAKLETFIAPSTVLNYSIIFDNQSDFQLQYNCVIR